MDRRREPRFETEHPVQVTLLDEEEVTLDGRMVNISGCGLRLILDRAVPLNTAVRVDCVDSILLGEVCYVEQQDDAYAVGVSLDQAVNDLAQLAQLKEAVFSEIGSLSVLPFLAIWDILIARRFFQLGTAAGLSPNHACRIH